MPRKEHPIPGSHSGVPQRRKAIQMAINPTRSTTRLQHTAAALDTVMRKLSSQRLDITIGGDQVTALRDQLLALTAKIDALKDAWSTTSARLAAANAVDHDDVAQLKAAAEAVVPLESQRELLLGECKTTAAKVAALEGTLPQMMAESDQLQNRLVQQQAALDRVSAAYPAALKRHLRKCRQYGWADARLAGSKNSKK
jgi:predicted  nucleic acid-binding Zn-ribbon protein